MSHYTSYCLERKSFNTIFFSSSNLFSLWKRKNPVNSHILKFVLCDMSFVKIMNLVSGVLETNYQFHWTYRYNEIVYNTMSEYTEQKEQE